MVDYGIILNSFSNIESIENTIKNLTICGFSKIEVPGDPKKFLSKKNLETFNSYNMSVIGVNGIWTNSNTVSPRVLLTNDHNFLTSSKNYIKDCIKMCNFFGGYFFNICILSDYNSLTDKNHESLSNTEKKKKLKKLIPLLSELTLFSQDYGITLLLEPLTRYSTPYLTEARDAIFLASIVGNDDYLSIVLDTYHMNIEEESFEDAIVLSKNYLKHMHFADNNRKMPGYGHIDFGNIISCLSKINYNNCISFEPIIMNKNYYFQINRGFNYIKKIVNPYIS